MDHAIAPAPEQTTQPIPLPPFGESDPEALFEVHTLEGGAVRIYRIYADGRVTGFGQHTKLVNRFGKMRDRDLAEIKQAQQAK